MTKLSALIVGVSLTVASSAFAVSAPSSAPVAAGVVDAPVTATTNTTTKIDCVNGKDANGNPCTPLKVESTSTTTTKPAMGTN